MYTQNYTTNYQVCKMDKKGAVRGSKYYAFATMTPDGELIETAEVVSAKLDGRKARTEAGKKRQFAALAKREQARQAARAEMERNGWW